LYLNNYSENLHNTELHLGDFGVFTMMKEAKTRTRITKDAFDYTAPEIIDAQSFNQKSDLWSVGATLLDVCTTSLYDVTIRLLLVFNSNANK